MRNGIYGTTEKINYLAMPQRKNPQTSLEAYWALPPEQVSTHHSKIISAIRSLGGAATADMVAQKTGMQHVQINRRFIELAREEKIVNTKKKKLTRSGRNAFVFRLLNK